MNNFEKDQNEILRNENEYLKMKLMLERGAVFGGCKDLPPEVENAFLKSIMEVEKQFDAGNMDDAGPGKFTALPLPGSGGYGRKIKEPDVDEGKGIPQIVDGLAQDNAYFTMQCMYDIFSPGVSSFDGGGDELITLNQHEGLTTEEFMIIIRMFRNAYDNMVLEDIEITESVLGDTPFVTGTYKLSLAAGKELCTASGNWSVSFKEESEGFRIMGVQIEGVNF